MKNKGLDIKFKAKYQGREWKVWRIEWFRGKVVAMRLSREGKHICWAPSLDEEIILEVDKGE